MQIEIEDNQPAFTSQLKFQRNRTSEVEIIDLQQDISHLVPYLLTTKYPIHHFIVINHFKDKIPYLYYIDHDIFIKQKIEECLKKKSLDFIQDIDDIIKCQYHSFNRFQFYDKKWRNDQKNSHQFKSKTKNIWKILDARQNNNTLLSLIQSRIYLSDQYFQATALFFNLDQTLMMKSGHFEVFVSDCGNSKITRCYLANQQVSILLDQEFEYSEGEVFKEVKATQLEVFLLAEILAQEKEKLKQLSNQIRIKEQKDEILTQKFISQKSMIESISILKAKLEYSKYRRTLQEENATFQVIYAQKVWNKQICNGDERVAEWEIFLGCNQKELNQRYLQYRSCNFAIFNQNNIAKIEKLKSIFQKIKSFIDILQEIQNSQKKAISKLDQVKFKKGILYSNETENIGQFCKEILQYNKETENLMYSFISILGDSKRTNELADIVHEIIKVFKTTRKEYAFLEKHLNEINLLISDEKINIIDDNSNSYLPTHKEQGSLNLKTQEKITKRRLSEWLQKIKQGFQYSEILIDVINTFQNVLLEEKEESEQIIKEKDKNMFQ